MSEKVTKTEAAVEAAVAEDSVMKEAAPKKGKKKLPIILGVVAAVVIAAGAGFWVWHEQPSFCNAICHTPMDPFLPTYEAEVGAAATDKWGNEVADSSAMLACVHREWGEKMKDPITCMGCHVPTLSEQIGEGLAWVAGDYEVVENAAFGAVLTEKSLEDLVAARGVEPDEFCLNDACHKLTREQLEKVTADYERNPHVAQHQEVACSECHKAHRASVNYCSQCHEDADIPEGWLSVAEAKALGSVAA